jgi:phosphate transport system permease protein
MSAALPASQYKRQQDLERAEPRREPPGARRPKAWADTLFSILAHSAAILTLLLLAGIVVSLIAGAAPAIREYGLSFLWRSEWDPVKDQYGGLVMIYGTVATSLIALVIAVPVSFGIALFLTELAPDGCAGRSAWRSSCWPRCRPSSMACGACWSSAPSCRSSSSSRCSAGSATRRC